MKEQKIFGLQPTTIVEEFFGLVKPMTTMLFKIKSRPNSSYRVDDSGIKKIYILKPTKGKWGRENVVTFIDYLWYSFVATLMLPYLLRFKKILVHSPPFFQAHLILLLRLFGKKVYLIVIDEQLHYSSNPIKKLYYIFADLLEYISVRFSTKVFVTAKYMQSKYKKYKKEVYYTPNGADVETISSIKSKRKFKKFTITYLGGFEKWRGIDLLIKAFIDAKRNHEMKLLLIGVGPYLDEAKKIANNDPDIIFTGAMDHDNAIAYCKGSDVLVMPSKNVHESKTISSIKCFEYIACEVPSIVTDSGEHADWVRNLGSGLIVKDNTTDIRKAIMKLHDDKKLYDKIKQNCKKRKWKVDYKILKRPFVEEVLND